MKKFLFVFVLGLLPFYLRPKKVQAPMIMQHDTTCYPGSDISILPGDVLFSPIGRKESRYVGHVGIVTENNEVVHSIPAGLARDSVELYFHKFKRVSIYSPFDPSAGEKACEHLEYLYHTNKHANYRIMTPIGSRNYEQYWTKIIWQAYFHGAGINLGKISQRSKAVHPERLKDRRHLRKKK
ncbi:hypothetical protein [Halobacillus litoralis]|uniref:hypothetical protein n=1 Tax=Halobacillus litoralis TaxID=45668 RepID=UPI0024932C70|nr:hypothetical protein [Halobacillus litoralis]